MTEDQRNTEDFDVCYETLPAAFCSASSGCVSLMSNKRGIFLAPTSEPE